MCVYVYALSTICAQKYTYIDRVNETQMELFVNSINKIQFEDSIIFFWFLSFTQRVIINDDC